ncbi:MAG: LPS-assembly protein LptD [Candidatus Omnitrophica bacterium]|nr:LPS-assembly protein LptD [Candidatus Omnitrophota bacterium]
MKALSWLLVTFVFLAVSFRGFADSEDKPPQRALPYDTPFQSEGGQVQVVADQIEYTRDQQKIIARENVILRYQEIELAADYAEVETKSKKAYARGHVIIFRHKYAVARGEEVHYNFATDAASFPNGRTYHIPWFSSGEDYQQLKDGVQIVKKGTVTTCNLENPHYSFKAKKVTIYEGDKLIAKSVTIVVLGKPVFWLPYLIIPLNERGNLPFTLKAGYNSEHGAYLLGSKGFSINRNIGGNVHVDWRSKRGFGSGADVFYDYGKYFKGFAKGYLTQDNNAPTFGSDNPYREREDRTRGRLTWMNQTMHNKYNYIISRYNRFSDEQFLQDFFEKEGRAEIEPQSFVTLNHNTDRYGLMTYVEKRVNNFESLVERVPDVRFGWKNQPFFKSGIYYQSDTSFANLHKVLGRIPLNEDVWRIHQMNEWIAPLQWKGIKFSPFVNLGGTYYSREKESDEDRFRTLLGGGADLRTHAYKTFPVNFHRLGFEMNELRHVFEPSIQYRSVRSTVSDETIDHFDSTDRIDDADIVTFGIENRLQTKRVMQGQMKRVDVVSLNTFLSYEIHPDGRSQASRFITFEDASTSSQFSILSQDLVLRPYDWLIYEARFDYDMDRDSFRVFNQDWVTRFKNLRLLFGHRFVKGIGDVSDNGQFVFNARYRLNRLWELHGYVRWNENDLGLEEWQVSATRDLHDFILDFGYNVRNSAIRSNNKELFFNFRFKAFPEIHLGAGPGRASFGEPRIGENVAGANPSSMLGDFQSDFEVTPLAKKGTP